MDKFKEFIKKGNYTKAKLGLVGILSIILSWIFEYKFYTVYIDNSYDSKTRMIIMAIVFAFVLLHFVFKLNDLYEFIYKQRYKLACRIYVVCYDI